MTFAPGTKVRYEAHIEPLTSLNGIEGVVTETRPYSTTMIKVTKGSDRGTHNDLVGTEHGFSTSAFVMVEDAPREFKAGDRVVIDSDLMKKYDNDGFPEYWGNVGTMVLTEDSGSRAVKYTSHVKYDKDGMTNNVPTRWLKLYREPAKRVVGGTIKVADIKVGDKIKSTDTVWGLRRELTGVVSGISTHYGVAILRTEDSGLFPSAANGVVFTLLEEAPEPVDENLQRLLDTEIGDIAHSTYAHEYWKKVDDDAWRLLELDSDMVRTTEHVFNMFYKLKYGELHIFRKVEDGAE